YVCGCVVLLPLLSLFVLFFFYTAPPPSEIYTLSLHDALPIWCGPPSPTPPAPGSSPMRTGCATWSFVGWLWCATRRGWPSTGCPDRKSTRLNSSHEWISYAVFCLKKKKIRKEHVNAIIWRDDY